jgi:stress response protein SCP2
MPALPPGANQPLPTSRSLQLTLSTSSGRADLVVLCVDGDGRADGDNGVALWTQPQCAGGAVTIDPAAASAVIEPGRLADGIQRVLLVAQADGVDELSQCGSLSVQVTADGAAAAALSIPSPPALPTVQLAEVYRHGPGWKVRCLGDGYQEGLARLLEVHGIEIADEEQPAPEAAPPAVRPAIRLTKGEEQLPGDMRQRLSLRKEAVANVLFTKGIGDQRARVILVLDASGSMYELYPETMRNSVERVVAVAAQLDDDGSLEAWRFASRSQQLPMLELGELPHWLEHCVLLGEAESKATRRGLGRRSKPAYPQLEKVGVRNEEHKVLRDIREFVRSSPVPDPTLVLFFSDGGIYQDAKIEKHLIGSQEEPIFWQFIGLGTEEDYGVLERFDTLPGRTIDNVGFFSIDDIERIDDAELYGRILSEFPSWLRAARTAGLISG